MDAGNLFCGMMISMVGFVFFAYGKKSADGLAMIIGVILIAYTYFVDSLVLNIAIGAVVTGSYFLLKRIL